jgi:hypothetical protein
MPVPAPVSTETLVAQATSEPPPSKIYLLNRSLLI